MHPLDLWRTAKMLINRHGEEAPGQAWVRVMSLRQNRDEHGAAVWERIHEAVLELQRISRNPGEVEH